LRLRCISTAAATLGRYHGNPIDTGYGYSNMLYGVYQTFDQSSGYIDDYYRYWNIEEFAVRRSPNDAGAHVNFAATLTGLRRPDDALREIEAALKLRPDFGLAHLNAAAILAARGDAAGARAHLLQAAKDPVRRFGGGLKRN
jgi:tetratricopeptide (TPR) repeat protein